MFCLSYYLLLKIILKRLGITFTLSTNKINKKRFLDIFMTLRASKTVQLSRNSLSGCLLVQYCYDPKHEKISHLYFSCDFQLKIDRIKKPSNMPEIDCSSLHPEEVSQSQRSYDSKPVLEKYVQCQLLCLGFFTTFYWVARIFNLNDQPRATPHIFFFGCSATL